MPYKSVSELPDSVKKNLPAAAQRIWMRAFNSGYSKFNKDDAKASQYAWGAVKRVYKKDGDKWVKLASLDLRTNSWVYELDTDYLNIFIEELQLTTADIVDILPKKFWEVKVSHGLRVTPHIGKLLWEGSSSTYSSDLDLSDIVGQAVHLLEDTVSYGTIRLRNVVGNTEQGFYSYEVDWIKRFPGPLPVRLKSKKDGWGVIGRKRYSFKKLAGLNNIDLLYIHSYCHTGHSETIKEFHDLVATEINKRGLTHPIYSALDTGSTELPVPETIATGKPVTDTISIEQFLGALPEQFSIDAPPPKIWLTGNLADKGTTTMNEGVEIVIGQDTIDMRLLERFINSIKDSRISSSIRMIFDSEGPKTGYSIPLYRDSYQKLSYKNDFDPNDFLRYAKGTVYTDLQEVWSKWAGVRIGNGIIVEKRYTGTPVSIHYDGKDGFARNHKNPVKLSLDVKSDLQSIDRPFVAMGHYVHYDCNNIKVNKIEELCKPIQIEKSECAVLHISQLVYLDDKPIHNMSYGDRLKLLDVLIPEELVYLRKVPYTKVHSKMELEGAIETLSNINGYKGVVLRESDAPFNFNGKGTSLIELSSGAENLVIKLQLCNLANIETICPLFDVTHQSLSKVQVEELTYPIKCELASLMKCPLVKDYFYELSEPVEIKNWTIPLIEPKSSDIHTRPDQSDPTYSSYKESGGL